MKDRWNDKLILYLIFNYCFLFLCIGILCQRIGDLRLYSSYYSEGRLEIYYSYTWTPFSITGFDMHEANLACKNLGYSYASRYAKVGTLGYVISIFIYLSN